MAKKRRRARTIPPNLRDRIEAVRQRLDEWDVDALLVSNPRDVRYLSGFVGDDSWAVVPAGARLSRGPWLISDFRYIEQIEHDAPWCPVMIRKKSLDEDLAKLKKRLKLKRIAIQSAYTTLAQRKALAKHVGARHLKNVDDGLLKQRAVKDKGEIALLRKAGQIQQEAFRRTIRRLKPGQREEEIAGFLEYQMRLLGADAAAFPSIVAADANAALPHAIPGRAKVKKGGILLIDWGACYGGYRSDMTRVVALGSMSRRMRHIYQIVLEAQLAGIEAIGPGVLLKDVDAASRRVIKKAGFEKQFGHGLGHGIGLDIHELPNLSRRSKGELEPGQVVTVEPGIYLPGMGGVRIEDDVLVTARGHRVLTDLPKSLDSAIMSV